MSNESTIKSLALSQGFDLAGIASLGQAPQNLNRYTDWLEAGYAGEMDYLKRQKEKRLNPSLVLPHAKSMICVGLIYNHGQTSESGLPHIARYAQGQDYHEIMGARLAELEKNLHASIPGIFDTKAYCDTGPVSEKAWAAAAGLGWVGKHTNLINQKKGSWLFLGEILTTLELIADQPATDLCGSCRKCLDACPTEAFPQAYVLDAQRCISYLTIEKRGDIPSEFHEAIGTNVYGCDICQEVCPWNHWNITGHEAAFLPREASQALDVEKLANIPDEEFSRLYNGSAIKRTKAAGMRRNASIVDVNIKRLKEKLPPHP